MTWAFILSNLKWLVLGILGLWAAKEIKESGRKSEKLKHTEGQNKKLLHQQEYQILEFKRSEEQAKKARDYAQQIEAKLMEIDPDTLSTLQLNQLSQNPLSFTDIHTSPEQSSISGKDEDDQSK